MIADVPPEFLNFLSDEQTRARDTYLDQERTNALQFYNGDPYGDEEDGRSQVVTRDVAEVIDHMTVSILRTMVSDRVVEFSGGKGNEDEESTELVDQVFRQKLSGYKILHDWLKAGLLEKTGAVKTWVEPQPPMHTVHSIHPMLLDDARQSLNVVGAEPTEKDNEQDAPWLIKVAHEQPPIIRCATVPNEEFFVSYDARDLESAVYICHRTPKTISELRDMGFDVPDTLQGDEATVANNVLANARDSGRGSYWTGEERQGAVRTVWLDEEYVRYDLDGDGVAERLCVHRVGNDILSRDGKLAIDPVDEQCFDEWCPFPMPHRRVGQSLADKTMDIQRVNSVLLRNGLDSLYFSIAPGTYLSDQAEGTHTIDDLLTVRPNRIIRYKGATPPIAEVRPDTSATVFQAMEFMIGQRESRTGITRLNQGLDADALNKTATGTAMMQAQGQQIEEYVARNFAEAVASLFRRIRRLLKEHGQPQKVVINGQEVIVDPRTWSDEIEVHCRVGLGSNRKDQRLIYRQQLLGIQQQVMMGGLPIVGPTQVYNTIKGLVADAGLGNVNDFVVDPNSPEGQQMAQQKAQAPDPQAQKIEGELQLKAQANAAAQQHMQDKLQLEAGKVQGHLQLKAAETAGKLQQQGQKHMADVALSVAKNDAEGHLAVRQQNMDAALAERQMQQDRALEEMKIAHDASVAHHKVEVQKAIKKDRPGGALDK